MKRIYFFCKNLLKIIYYLSKSDMNLAGIFNVNVNCKLSKKALIYSPSSLKNVSLSYGSYIAPNSIISNTDIGKFCSIGPNFLCGYGIHPLDGISTAPMFYSVKKQNGFSLSDHDKIIEQKHIKIGNDVFIGANVTILDGVKIGDGAVIGAGAVVSKDIPPYCVAVGVPAKIIKKRFTEFEIKSLLKIKWWDWPEEKLKDVENHFFDLEKFININKINENE